MEIDKIYNEDCLVGMSKIPDNSIDCVICDLPYGITASKWDIVIPFDKLWEQYNRVCKENAAIVLFGSEPFSSKLRMSNLKAYKYDWIWQKNSVSGFLHAKSQPLRCCEFISVFYYKQCVYNPQMIVTSNMRRQAKFQSGHGTEVYALKNMHKQIYESTNEYYPRNILKFKTVHSLSKEKCAHSNQKPLDLIRYLVRTYTNKGDVVLDNCMGSGTTAVAALAEGRHFIGFETEPKYVDMANERIKEVISNPKLF